MKWIYSDAPGASREALDDAIAHFMQAEYEREVKPTDTDKRGIILFQALEKTTRDNELVSLNGIEFKATESGYIFHRWTDNGLKEQAVDRCTRKAAVRLSRMNKTRMEALQLALFEIVAKSRETNFDGEDPDLIIEEIMDIEAEASIPFASNLRFIANELVPALQRRGLPAEVAISLITPGCESRTKTREAVPEFRDLFNRSKVGSITNAEFSIRFDEILSDLVNPEVSKRDYIKNKKERMGIEDHSINPDQLAHLFISKSEEALVIRGTPLEIRAAEVMLTDLADVPIRDWSDYLFRWLDELVPGSLVGYSPEEIRNSISQVLHTPEVPL